MKEYQDSEILRELYHEKGMSTHELADELGVSQTTICRWMDKHEIPRDIPVPERPPHYCEDAKGYMVWRHKQNGIHHKVKVHRLLAVAEFGYDAVVGNDVHHKNHHKIDNRPDNIELINRSKHRSNHAKIQPRNNKGQFV